MPDLQRPRRPDLPHSGDIEVNRQPLPPKFPDTWHGLVFVCLHEPNVSLEQKLAGLDNYLTKFDLQRFTNGYHSEPQHWSSNWKLRRKTVWKAITFSKYTQNPWSRIPQLKAPVMSPAAQADSYRRTLSSGFDKSNGVN